MVFSVNVCLHYDSQFSTNRFYSYRIDVYSSMIKVIIIKE